MSEQREQYQATDEKLKQIAADLAGDGSKPEDYELVHVTTRHRQQLPTGQEILDKLDDLIDRTQQQPVTLGTVAAAHILFELKEWIVLEPKPEAEANTDEQQEQQ